MAEWSKPKRSTRNTSYQLEQYYKKKKEFFEGKVCEVCKERYDGMNLLLVRKDVKGIRTSRFWNAGTELREEILKNCMILCSRHASYHRLQKYNREKYGNPEGHGSLAKYLKGCSCRECTRAKFIQNSKRKVFFILNMTTKRFTKVTGYLEMEALLKDLPHRVTILREQSTEFIQFLQKEHNEKALFKHEE